MFLKNFCFKDAVKVKRFYVSNDEEFISKVFERNFFANIKLSFCLVQQITPDDEKKYFIFGIKFDDLYILDSRSKIAKNIFVYEKTYLFISNEPLCKLFENIFTFILNFKKLNFYKVLEEYSSLLKPEKLKDFHKKNNENSSEGIIDILDFFHKRSYPRKEEYISYHSPISQLSMNYKHPNKSNECFLPMHYLSINMFKLMTTEVLYDIILRVLAEQNFLFITDNIQNLTALVLGIYYLIQPFKWPFIIIPNLPLDLIEVVQSPVPFMIGILADKTTVRTFIDPEQVKNANIIYFDRKITFLQKVELGFEEPYLNNLKMIINQNLSDAQYALSKKMNDNYETACEMLYKNIYGIIKSEIADVIVNIVKKKSSNSQNSFEFTSETFKYKNDSLGGLSINDLSDDDYKKCLKKSFIKVQKKKNLDFAKFFSQTQIFASYVDELIENLKKSEDDY